MPLNIPSHLAQADIQRRDITYEWDEWDLNDIFVNRESDEFDEKIEQISYRAHTALAVATGEWIIHRFRSFPEAQKKEKDLDWMIEAGWAAVVDVNYHSLYKPHETEEEEDIWKGPVMFPLAIVNVIIIDAAMEQAREGSRTSATDMSSLARHVLPDTDAFLAWRDAALDKLVAQYPLDEDEDETLGEVVPREFFELDKNFDINTTEAVIKKFLRTLDPYKNPFLYPSDIMLELNFEGTPYQFDIEAERKNRIEW